MASLKNLKKDIDYLVESVCADCYTSTMFRADIDTVQIAGIISTALAFREEMRERANKPNVDKSDKKALNNYYSNLEVELMEGIDKMFVALSDCIK